MKECPICKKGNLVEVNDIVSEVEGHFFIQKGKRCSSCGEEFIDEKEGQRMIEVARKLGIWGQPLKLHRKLSRSARATVLRIPTDIEKNMNLKGDEEVLISKLGKNKLLIEIAN
ncbi:YgiT-type zinc finger protein [Candidatus Woesearchaeota archaeon]|nr:YgiT-type zinc finger protein [Candidatus Woesearchaeota archaeon]